VLFPLYQPTLPCGNAGTLLDFRRNCTLHLRCNLSTQIHTLAQIGLQDGVASYNNREPLGCALFLIICSSCGVTPAERRKGTSGFWWESRWWWWRVRCSSLSISQPSLATAARVAMLVGKSMVVAAGTVLALNRL
jgi:hypothetical protein